MGKYTTFIVLAVLMCASGNSVLTAKTLLAVPTRGTSVVKPFVAGAFVALGCMGTWYVWSHTKRAQSLSGKLDQESIWNRLGFVSEFWRKIHKTNIKSCLGDESYWGGKSEEERGAVRTLQYALTHGISSATLEHGQQLVQEWAQMPTSLDRLSGGGEYATPELPDDDYDPSATHA